MKIKNSISAVSLAILMLGLPHTAHAQFGGLFSSILNNVNSIVDANAIEREKQPVVKAIDPEIARLGGDFSANKPQRLRPFFMALYVEGERNAVLNLVQLGLAAMESGQYEVAKKAFDLAIARIDAIYADDPNAQKAKSVWNEEKVKDWKGEPYERAMVYYYRGLLYLKDGEYDNAAASFKAADYQDTQAEKETFQGDFGIMAFMAAWAQSCRGNMTAARDLQKQAVSKDPSVAALSLDTKFMVLIDSGVGPTKVGKGRYKEVLTFDAAPNSEDSLVKVDFGARAAASQSTTVPVGDIQFQATTRGGRAIDGILNGKAEWKGSLTGFGDAALAAGVVFADVGSQVGSLKMEQMGMFGSLFGLAAKITANNMTPAADTRYWGSLPNKIYAAGLKVYPMDANLFVEFSGAGGTGRKPLEFVAKNGDCSIAWARTRSSLTPAAGGTAMIAEPPIPSEDERVHQNAALRQLVVQNFAGAGQ